MTTTMTIEEYAKHILEENDCDIYTYGGKTSAQVLHDLKEAYCVGDLAYPYIDVANAIIAISKPKPFARPFRVLWDNEHACDSFGAKNLDDAKYYALDVLTNWIVEAKAEWSNETPTEAEKDNFNLMIWNCSVSVEEYNTATGEYEEVWSPSDDDLNEIGWKEIE